ncbi:LytTR family DNA-binding domain-containing protein [Clostridium beijerinckii]|jgi:Response regulator of the LytR/AlgR family|uniref:LytTR family transcriptional regulator n=3 Tax=Clostridium beijerinckii TaxID=1520 RepID=A0AAE2RQD7_CLOBE|nr:LytTR family DNA-binding domain-containing protein [Clostridium beijerinckii]ABR35627.1 response regulator receiver protein [Clostridium beijerinckii NCIMB 8052]AIU02731.1 response regulator receiver protein [Clostridium beijerinckii ATCC 35702]MBF7809735.1 LytTR family transcriptional regulator [Clostridium beijerinckii]MCI1581058.1 LytTR family transcriptional regulator [Clostridium beijerinckii]MCI1584817.1 LytTR family transcriptional regulator [Clostridium beijerinckii]
MKVSINIISSELEEEVIFNVHNVQEKITEAIELLTSSNEVIKHLLGRKEEKYYKVNVDEIFYIESIDRKVFIYTKTQTYEISEKLYVLEEQLSSMNFIRISKSLLLNIDKIHSFYPKLSGNLETLLTNNEKVIISRRYVANLKNKLGMRDSK